MVNSQTKELSVAAIRQGTVIDHITAGQALLIARILRLPMADKIVTIGLNLPSKLMHTKDLIKVEGRELSPEEANQVALFAPEATISIIRDYHTVKKFAVSLPENISGFIVCPNPKCITNNERMFSNFTVIAGQQIKVRCHYCEKIFRRDEINNFSL